MEAGVSVKKFLFFLFIPSIVFGGGPLFLHKETEKQQEFENVYKDIHSKRISTNSSGVTCIDSPTLCVDEINHRVGIGTLSPSQDLMVQRSTNSLIRIYASNTNTTAAQERRSIVGALGNNSGSEIDLVAGLDSSGTDFQYLGGSSKTQIGVGGTPFWNMDSTGRITQSAQPCFYAYAAVDQAGVTGNTNADVNVLFGTEVFDVGSNFASSSFTAPIAGKYYFQAQMRVGGLTAAMTSHVWKIKTTGHNFDRTMGYTPTVAGSLGGNYTYFISAFSDMAAGDKAFVTLNVFDGAANAVTISGTTDGRTYFSGTLVN